MFSGIVEGLAEVKKIEQLNPGIRMYIDLGKFSKGVRESKSICISGCCLTVTRMESTTAVFDLMPETLFKTYFERLKERDMINVERSIRLGDEIGGHIVTGHVDCTGEIVKKKDFSEFSEIVINFPIKFSHWLIEKGSVSVDGISLTVIQPEKGTFKISLIPHTLKLTTIGSKKPGDLVNIEFDQTAKYIEKLLNK